MGSWFSCFNSKKSKNGVNGQNENDFDAGIKTCTSIKRGHQFDRQETDELLSSTPVRIAHGSGLNHDHMSNSVTATTGTVRKTGFIQNGTSNTISGLNSTTAKDHNCQLSDNTLNALFEEYKDEYEDAILSEGIERLCDDLGYKPDDFAILVLAWRLDASQMCRFTKSEFIMGLQLLNADTIEGIRMRLEQIIEKLKVNSEMFKQLYRFTFRFGLEPENRIVMLDMAIILWRLVFTVHKPDILDRWLDYLEMHTNIRGVPKDTWNMFLNFAETCDITAYDDTEAWPSLFDDFVEYENDRLNQNLKNDGDLKKDTVDALRGADCDSSSQHL